MLPYLEAQTIHDKYDFSKNWNEGTNAALVATPIQTLLCPSSANPNRLDGLPEGSPWTPNINARGAKPGRDHYPRAWSLMMLGGGVKGGTVYGKTDAEGATVEDGKTNAMDFLATVCELMGIDATKENETPTKRPIRIVDKAGKPVRAVIG